MRSVCALAGAACRPLGCTHSTGSERMPRELRTLEVRNRQEWRRWLSQHHVSSPGVWLVFHKNHTGAKALAYEDSVRDALCFGWIDSLIKRLDDRRYSGSSHPAWPRVGGRTSIGSAGWN